jgi:3-hydroxyacyl-[acyl-carrier-protein] dehydratase
VVPIGRPGRPIVPGVIMIEALAQTCAVCVLSMPENHGRQPLFAGIDTMRFKRIVVPGDELEMTCEVESLRATVGKGKVVGRVGGELALRGMLMFATVE